MKKLLSRKTFLVLSVILVAGLFLFHRNSLGQTPQGTGYINVSSTVSETYVIPVVVKGYDFYTGSAVNSSTLYLTVNVGGWGTINVSSINSVSGAPVPASWYFPSGPDDPCGGSLSACSGTSATYTSQPFGTYTIGAPYPGQTNPANYTFAGVKYLALKLRQSSISRFLVGTAKAQVACEGTSLADAYCGPDNIGVWSLTISDSNPTADWVIEWTPNALMTLSATSVSFSVSPGANITKQITVSNTGAASSTLNWSASTSSDSSWLTVSPASGSLTAPSDSVPASAPLSVTADATGLSAGTHTGTITFSATQSPASGQPVGSPQTVIVTFNVQDFSLSVSPASQSVTQGQSVSYSVGISDAGGGFNSSVSLSASNLPAGVTATFSPTSIGPGQSSVLALSADGSTSQPGTYAFTVTGTSGSITHTANAALVINAPQVSCSTFTASPPKTIYSPPSAAGSSTLAWACTNVSTAPSTTCVVSDGKTPFYSNTYTTASISDSVIVAPTSATTYYLHCGQYSGVYVLQTTVTVVIPTLREQ